MLPSLLQLYLKSDSIAALPLRQQRILAVGIILSQFKFGIVLKLAFI